MREFKDRQNCARVCGIIFCCYILLSIVFYWASGEQLYYQREETAPITATDCAAVMTDGTTVAFAVSPQTEIWDQISLLIGTYGRENQGELVLQVFSEDGTELTQSVLPTAELPDYVYQDFAFEAPLEDVKGRQLSVVVTAQNVPEEQGVSLWYGTTVMAGKFSVPDPNGSAFAANGVETDGKICYATTGRNILWVGQWYWRLAFIFGCLLAGYCGWIVWAVKRGKSVLPVRAAKTFQQYFFLVRQLVARDFKRKYKRSALGVLWSFLNPLLTMLVQYLVFSTIFKSNIENFVVYLLSGIILFNFFGESVGLGLNSIVDNAHLINKVYMPKVIYPLSRVLSSAINLLISMIPLVIVMLVTKVPLSKSMLLIPFGLLCLLLFCFGMSMLLSASMVFFRDTQFLWNVVSTLWMYLTPTFYPIDIIPEAWLSVYKLNPMYQYITFLRSILLDEMAPAPALYGGCIVSACLALALGYLVFRKNQDKFVLYL